MDLVNLQASAVCMLRPAIRCTFDTPMQCAYTVMASCAALTLTLTLTTRAAQAAKGEIKLTKRHRSGCVGGGRRREESAPSGTGIACWMISTALS